MRQRIAKMVNNRFVNPIVIFFGIEKIFMELYNPYRNFKADASKKSVREIAGFSHNEYIDKVINKIKQILWNAFHDNCPKDAKILEIGCGPGNYIEEFKKEYKMSGVDINDSMINIAKSRFPDSDFFLGDFIKIPLPQKYDAVYCIGTLQYFYPSQIKYLMKKVSEILNPEGIFIVNFPHALSEYDTKFPDLSYSQYSPEYIRKNSSDYFKIITDMQTIDERKITIYDEKPYKNPVNSNERTYLNSYTIILKKK